MKLAVLKGQGRVELEDAPEPEPGPGEVIVETAVSAICGSELRGYRGGGSPSGNSGHEAAGTVVRLGKGVVEPAIGRRVGASAVAGCGGCAYCLRGQYTWCDARKTYSGMHAERFVIAACACHPLPDDVPWDVGVLISGDGLGVAYHTSRKIAAEDIRDVAVFGMGPVGLGSVLLQNRLGRRVMAVDISEYRLGYAARLGAAQTIDAGREDAVSRIRELTDNAGADVTIEAAGRPETAAQCFSSVRKGGTVVFNGEQGAISLSPSDDFIRRDITAVGSWFYHFHEFADMLALWRGGLDVAGLVSHRFPLAASAEAYAEFAAARTAKVLLTMKE